MAGDLCPAQGLRATLGQRVTDRCFGLRARRRGRDPTSRMAVPLVMRPQARELKPSRWSAKGAAELDLSTLCDARGLSRDSRRHLARSQHLACRDLRRVASWGFRCRVSCLWKTTQSASRDLRAGLHRTRSPGGSVNGDGGCGDIEEGRGPRVCGHLARLPTRRRRTGRPEVNGEAVADAVAWYVDPDVPVLIHSMNLGGARR